jgi:hypothetical protein
MPLTDSERHAALTKALDETKDQGTSAQAEAVQRVLFTQPSQSTTDDLWTFLIKGLIVLVGIALIAIVVLIAVGKYQDVALTVFTALLAGLLGLFVDNPAAATST